MNKKVLLSLIIALLAVTAAAQVEFQSFLQRLGEVYSTLRDLQATVTIKKLTAEGREKDVGQVRIGTLVKQKVLRLEYLEPPEMRGQVFTLSGYQLSQYFPVNNTIVVQEITESHVLYPLLEFLNFNLEEIVARLQEEGFSLTISQWIVPLTPTAELSLTNTISGLAGGYSAEPLALGLSLAEEMEGLPLELKVSRWKLGDYLLEAIPAEEGPVSKELIWIDPLDLVPRRVETHYERRVDGKVREEVTIYLISDIRINQGLTEEGLLALPKDARIIHAPPK
jgi:outer membrane lipoprotein-sorting protein